MTDLVQKVSDQYADGVVTKVWEYYLGKTKNRTDVYRGWLLDILKKRGSHHVLDVACGNGIDSVMLLEEGYRLTSCDGSDKMVLKACRVRWERRKEPAFDEWEIEVANWLSLEKDITKPGDGFDAMICIGNSFAHLPDVDGSQSSHRQALTNFAKMLKPGGVLIIDHRNFDAILETGKVPERNIYYHNSSIKDIKASVTYDNGKPRSATLDYFIDTAVAKEHLNNNNKVTDTNGEKVTRHKNLDIEDQVYQFTLSYYPHRVDDFANLLKECFGSDTTHTVYGDYKQRGEIENPAFWIHVVEKNS